MFVIATDELIVWILTIAGVGFVGGMFYGAKITRDGFREATEKKKANL